MRITFHCTNVACHEPLDASADRAGKAVKCPHCGTRVVIPATSAGRGDAGPSTPVGSVSSSGLMPVPPARRGNSDADARPTVVPTGEAGESSDHEGLPLSPAFLYGALSVGGLAGVAILFLLLFSLGRGPVASAPATKPAVSPAAVPATGSPAVSPATTSPVVPALVSPSKTAPAPQQPALVAPSSGPTLSTEEIVSRSEHAVAFVKGKFSSGTGFLVGRGILATNAHVISTELVEDLTVSFPSATGEDRQGHRAELIYEDSRRDLAFLLVPTSLAPLSMAPAQSFRRGQDLVAIGCPSVGNNALQNAVSRGILSTEVTLNRNRFYQLDMGINPGNSGGPVINTAGQVLGVATLKARKEEHLAFCIPSDEVQTALESLGNQPAERSAEIASLHRARVCGLYIARVTQVYLVGMDIYAKEAQRAAASGRSAAESVRQVADQLEPRLEAIRRMFVGDIVPVLQQVAQDPNVPRPVREQLSALWSNFNSAKQHVLYPRGTIETYRSKAEEFRTVQDDLLASLQISLGIEIEP